MKKDMKQEKRKDNKASQAEGLAISEFLGSMATLVENGIAEEDALLTLKADGSELAAAVTAVYDLSFARAVRDAGVFPAYVCDMIDIGTATGRLDDVLYGLSDYYERQARVEENVAQTIIYPSVVLFILSGILLFLATAVFPTFKAVYRHIAGTSAALTGLITATTVLSFALFALCLAAGVFTVVLFYKWRHTADKTGLIAFFAKFPTFESVIREHQLAKFTLAVSTCIGAGIDDAVAVEAASKLLDLKSSRARARAIAARVEDGANIVAAIRDEDFFNMADIRILTGGYRSGKLTEAFDRVAERQWQTAEEKIASLTESMGPALMLIIAVIIGMLLIAVMLPLIAIMVSTL